MTNHKNNSPQYPSPSKKVNETVRTTFNVSAKTHASMLSLCETFNRKQKELIDEIIVPTAQIMFKDLDPEIVKTYKNSGELQRRTFTLSKESLAALNELSKKKGVQRDILFLKGILVQKSMLENQLKEINKKHGKAAKLIEELGEKCQKIERDLDGGDPLKNRVSIINIMIDDLLSEIETELKDGTPIDPNF